MSIFSDRVFELMKKNGLNQKELAQKVGVTESAMSYYIKGERTPRSDVLKRIAITLSTSVDYLLGTNNSNERIQNNQLQYLQRNLSKLDPERLKKAEDILKMVFDDIFNDEEEEDN